VLDRLLELGDRTAAGLVRSERAPAGRLRGVNDAEVFWQAVAASVAAATALSTGLAWAIGNWARNRSRAEADWAYTVHAYVITNGANNDHGTDGDISVKGSFANAGDAKAFRLTMTPSSGKGGLITPSGSMHGPNSHEWMAVMDPGMQVNFWCHVPADDWQDFEMTLDWITTPTRLKKHIQFVLKPREILPTPQRIKDWSPEG